MKKPSKILYFGKKALAFLLSVFVLSLAVFYVSRLAPGDPLVSYYGDRAEKLTPQERAQAEEKLGLDEPIFTQYVRWAQNALHGDFGISYKYKMPAGEVIASRAGNTLLLGGVGFVLIFTLSLLLGMLCAQREGTLFDRAVCKLGTITSCIPEFWLSLLLILIFAIELRVLPSSGAYSIGQQNNIADRAAHLILPLAVVVLGHLWYYAYMIRNRLLDEMRADYVLLAKSKGLTRRAVMLRHCLRNTMPAYLSIMAISVPHVLGGTYIVETVFSYPGLGTLAYESARYKDYNLLMLLSLLSGALVIGLTSWTSIAKVVRTEVQQLRASEYVIAAKCMGGSFFHILRCHLAPNFFSSILFMVVMNVRSAIIAESTLSFMGLGLPIEVVTWGSMLSLAEKALMTDAWWILLIPGAFLVVTLLCITTLGDYLRSRTSRKESNL